MTASAILASLNAPSSASPAPSHASPPSSAHQQLDPWSATGNSASHLPLSISQSINNPGLPSGVIVSSAAVNGMAMNGNGTQSSTGLARSETPGVPGSTSSGPGGKLLLGAGAGIVPITSSLIQPGSVPGNGGNGQSENEKVYYLIVDLMSPTTREGALLELSKKREQWDDLALVLWHSFGASSLSSDRKSVV